MTTKSEVKHTPGPWKVLGTTIKTRNFGGEWKLQSSGFNLDDADIANAHLIASAPELLEALKYAYDLWGSCPETAMKFVPNGKHVGDVILAAILKAEGGK